MGGLGLDSGDGSGLRSASSKSSSTAETRDLRSIAHAIPVGRLVPSPAWRRKNG